jgi:predicted component of type VI protein secretion system
MVDASPLTINSDEILIGSSPEQASLVLQDGSIEKLHARLVRKAEGSFRIIDEGSIAGTWINYSPVSKNGADLEHGDIIHIGRLGFRFTIRQPKSVRRPVITPVASQAPIQPSSEVKNTPDRSKSENSATVEKTE